MWQCPHLNDEVLFFSPKTIFALRIGYNPLKREIHFELLLCKQCLLVHHHPIDQREVIGEVLRVADLSNHKPAPLALPQPDLPFDLAEYARELNGKI